MSTKVAASIAIASVALAGCGGRSDDSTSPTTTITVLAASSLTETFTALKKTLEGQNKGLTVKLSFAASSTLVTQLNNGFQADIIALADEKSLTNVKPALVQGKTHTLFATNRLEIATPADNPAQVAGLDSLASAKVDTVLCAVQVPCGRAASTVLKKAGVNPHVISYEANVKATLAKVSLGEADAAVVYVTDIAAAGAKVKGIPIPEAQNVVTKLPIVDLTGNEASRLFYNAVTQAAGQRLLADAGFGTP